MKSYVTEFIGTFFLVLTIGLTVTSGTILAPLAIGVALMVMVYMGGHVSGAHYNPAVSLAILIRGKMATKDLVPYWVSQVLGAVAAAAIVQYVTGKTFPCAPDPTVGAEKAVLIEVLYTFALALVVLNVATAKGTANNSFYGLAIGFTVCAGAFAGGGISGGAYNPAVGAGPIIMSTLAGKGGMGNLWIYLAGPLAGGVLAALVFKIQNPDDN